jgi:hypothetical protein
VPVKRTARAAVIASCVVLGLALLPGVREASVTAQTPSAERPVAILTVISGDVLVRAAWGEFVPAADGAVLYIGSTVRTGPDARALITLVEGSTVELDPASDSTIEASTVRSDSSLMQLARSLGRSWRVVTHLTVADSRYEQRTPAATASVRGIASEVAVEDAPAVPETTGTTAEPTFATAVAAATMSVPRARISAARHVAKKALPQTPLARATPAGRYAYRLQQSDRDDRESGDRRD